MTPGDIISCHRLGARLGAEIKLEKVLMVGSKDWTAIGTPLVDEASLCVKATVLEHARGAKVVSFKKKRRKGYKRKVGHRQELTRLRVNSIEMDVDA